MALDIISGMRYLRAKKLLHKYRTMLNCIIDDKLGIGIKEAATRPTAPQPE